MCLSNLLVCDVSRGVFVMELKERVGVHIVCHFEQLLDRVVILLRLLPRTMLLVDARLIRLKLRLVLLHGIH